MSVEAISAKIDLAKGVRQQSAKETAILGFKAFDKILESSEYEFKLLNALLSEPLQNGLSIMFWQKTHMAIPLNFGKKGGLVY